MGGKMAEKKITIREEKLEKENKKLKEKLKENEFCKNLIFNCANSKSEPLSIINGLKFAAQQIKKKNLDLARRLASTSGNLDARGICPKCQINLFGKDVKPTIFCEIKDCPFENQMIKEKNHENNEQRTG